MNPFGLLFRGLRVPAPTHQGYGGTSNYARYSIGPGTTVVSTGDLNGAQSGVFVVKNTGEATIYLVTSNIQPPEDVIVSVDGVEGTVLGWPLQPGEVENFTELRAPLFATCETASELWIRVGA